MKGKRKKKKVSIATIATNGKYRLETSGHFKGSRTCLISITFNKAEPTEISTTSKGLARIRDTKIKDWSENLALYLVEKGHDATYTVKNYLQPVVSIWLTKSIRD